MSPKEFVEIIRSDVIRENAEFYRKKLEESPVQDAKDPKWRELLILYNELNPDQRIVFVNALKHVMVSVTSNILGILDGVCSVEGITEDFVLKYPEQNSTQLNGDLQDWFLIAEEKSPS